MTTGGIGVTERNQIEVDGARQVTYQGELYDVLAQWERKHNQVIIEEHGRLMVLRKSRKSPELDEKCIARINR